MVKDYQDYHRHILDDKYSKLYIPHDRQGLPMGYERD